MSTTKLITIICWIVVAVVLVGLAVWFLTGNLFGFRTGFKIDAPVINFGDFDNIGGSYNEVGSYTVPVDGIDTIEVRWVAGAAKITPYDGDTIKITEYARRDLKDKEKLVYSTSGHKLDIKYVSPGLSINMLTKKLELLVPKTLADKLNELNIDATSAEVTVSDFSADTFAVKETSGTADITNIKADSADVHSVSGEIELTNLTSSRLSAGTVSGEINMDGVTADTLKSETTSGGQELGGTFKDVEASSVSGEIRITSSSNPDRMNCNTTSGGIVVTIPGSGNLSVSYHTNSGRFTSDIPVITGGGTANYKFSSVSGDIRLKAA